jgi:NodT family efflux transporter outer membrane factor (OMF) lipoprotein
MDTRAPQELPATFDNLAPQSRAPWPGPDWYRAFSSAQLDALVIAAEALSGNGNLAAARARVVQADARSRQAGAAILPAVTAGGNANYLGGHAAQGSGHETDWAVLLSASYEVDFWGKNRAASDSARYLAAAARAERDTVALTTLAAVADGYFQVLALRERLSGAQEDLATAQQLLRTVQARFQAGAASPVELATQAAAADKAALRVPDLQQQEQEARAALALLVGHPPEGFDVGGELLDSLTEPAVGAGLPAQLLTRRPDVFLAEANLRAAQADITVARAAMLPSLSLTAAGGVQNPALNAAILSIPGTGATVALSGSLMASIFDHGRLAARRTEVEARHEELLALYRTAILAALGDTENALASIRHLDEAQALQNDSLAQAQRAFEGARARYQAGAGDHLTLLEAQRSLNEARDQIIQYRLARLQARVALCKALGGGWQTVTAAGGNATDAGEHR